MKRNSRVDERSVSWKVLLPTGSGKKVLALGLSEGQLSGLARSYDCIDTGSASDIVYDIIILGNNAAKDTHSIHDLISKAKPDGIVVNTDSYDISEQLNEAGFNYCGRYAGLPAHQPRMYIPLDSVWLREKGLSFHNPGSLKAKIALSLAKCLSRIGFKWHLMKNTVSIFATDRQNLNAGGIINWVSGRIGYEIVDLVVYGGSDSDRRKITALAIAKDGNNDIVVKTADTPLAVEAIKRETEALQDVAGSYLAGCVPVVIAEDVCGSYYVQIQEKLNIIGSQVSFLADAHLDFLAHLSRINRQQCLLKETSFWQKFKIQFDNTNDLPAEVEAIARYVFSEKTSNTKIISCRSHGDFAPWNISVKNGKLFVYDWEDSLADGLPFIDIFHFIYRQASLIGPWPEADSIIRQMIEKINKFAAKAEIPVQQIKLTLTVWALNEYVNQPCDKIIEILSSKEL